MPWPSSSRPSATTSGWRHWAATQGDDLTLFCAYDALADELGPDWRAWPDDVRHPGAPAVAARLADPALTARHELVAWIQWRLATELTDAAEAAAPCALIGDLAVGCSPDGADAWIHQDLFAHGVHIGAPPDPFNDAGQLWGLPPLVPWRLRARPLRARSSPCCAPASPASAGLRIDHVMGLFRQFWVPDGGTAADGAYVYLPAAELLALVCLEAHRAGGFVVGEDLGTSSRRCAPRWPTAGMLGTKVWMFDQDVEDWPEPNLGTVTTHDLPDRRRRLDHRCGRRSASRSSSSPARMRRCSTCSSPRTARSRPARHGWCSPPSTTSPAPWCGRTAPARWASTTGATGCRHPPSTWWPAPPAPTSSPRWTRPAAGAERRPARGSSAVRCAVSAAGSRSDGAGGSHPSPDGR